MTGQIVTEMLLENENIEEDTKQLWEKCYDFYKRNERYILGGLFVGQIVYMGYNIFSLKRQINELSMIDEIRFKDFKELESRIEKQNNILKQMDEENSKINMWFSQQPKLKEPKRNKFVNNARIK